MGREERAIKDLCQLSDADLFEEIAIGIGHVMNSVNELDAATRTLYEAGHHHPARVLESLAAEEAAKVLILVDAVRCPRNKQKERSRTLGYFYNHLAKGIYVEASAWHPENFAEVRRLVDWLRRDYYLEGPSPAELHWVFPNQITQWREDDLYVGYIRDDQGRHHWAPPHVIGTSYLTPAAIDLARTLHRAKATTPEGLSIVAEVWRPVEVRNEMRWLTEQRELNRKTLVELENRGLVPASTQIDGEIWDNWVFPLWPLNLQVCRVDKEKLQEQLSPCDSRSSYGG